MEVSGEREKERKMARKGSMRIRVGLLRVSAFVAERRVYSWTNIH